MSPLLHPVVDFDFLDLALDGAEGETQVPSPLRGGGLWLPRQGGVLPASRKGRCRCGRLINSGVVDNHIFLGNKFSLP